MANNAPNYSVTAAVGGPPQSEREISGAIAIRQSGEMAGEGNREAGQADAAAIKAVGTEALDITHGALLASEDKAIDALVQDVTGKLLAVPGSSAAAQKAINAGGQNPAGQFKSDTERLYAAWQQGVIDKTSYQLRMDGIVKKYSDMMPGWAKDFRANAAERFGMSGIEHLLSAQAQQNQLAKDMYEASLKMDQNVAAAYGINDISQITPQQRRAYAQNQEAKLAYERIKTQRDTTALQQQDNADAASKQFGALQANLVTGFQHQWEDFQVKNRGVDITSKGASDSFANDMSSFLVSSENKAILEINNMMSGPNPISAEQAKKFKDEYHTNVANLQEHLKTQEGRNLWMSTLKNSQAQAELLQNNFKILNPQMEFFKASGVLPPIAQYNADQGDEATIRKFGQFGAEWVKMKKTDPKAYYSANLATLKGDVDLKSVDQLQPGTANLIIGEDAQALRDGRGIKFNPAQAEDAYNRTKRFLENAALSGQAGANNMNIAINSGGLEATIKQLPPDRQQEVATLGMARGTDTIMALTPQIQAVKDQLTVGPNGFATVSKDPKVQQLVRDFNNNLNLVSMGSTYAGGKPVDKLAYATATMTGQPASHGAEIRKVESGGTASPNTAKNPNSSATGADQITTGTLETYRTQAAKILGVKPEQVDRTNPNHSAVIRDLNLAAGRAKLPEGMSTDVVDEYAIHHFGAEAGPKIVQARDNVPLRTLVSEAAMKANKYAHDLTVGAWRKMFAKRLGQ